MKKIVILGDLLRCPKINPFHADRMSKTVHELLRGQIAAATGVMPELILARDCDVFSREKFYSLSGYGEPREEEWVRIVSGEYSDSALAYFADCFRGTLVISHEAGSLIGVMADAGISYIDLRVAPIRFLDDILFCFKSNIPGVEERLLHYRMECDEIGFHVNKLRAQYCSMMSIDDIGKKLRCAELKPNSLLICGQSGADLSLIRNSRIVTLNDCIENLNNTIKNYSNIYYKKHPKSGDQDVSGEIVRTMHNILNTDKNIYRMLCDDNLAGVAALSSGVLTEARFFAKRVHFLSHEYIALSGDKSARGAEEYIMTHDEYFSPAFWSDVLSPYMETKNCHEFNFLGRKNLMRQLIDGWWGYEFKHDGDSSRNGTSGLLDILRKIGNMCDSNHKMRRIIDPNGSIRRRIMKILSRL